MAKRDYSEWTTEQLQRRLDDINSIIRSASCSPCKRGSYRREIALLESLLAERRREASGEPRPPLAEFNESNPLPG